MRKGNAIHAVLFSVIAAFLIAGCDLQSVAGQRGETDDLENVDPADYFSGESITIKVGFAPGGGYDTFARLFQKHGPNHFPGNPEFVVENMPGSAGLRAKQATMQAPADGLTVTMLHPTHTKRSLLGIDVEGFDINAARIVGTPNLTNDPEAAYVRRDIATSWEELQELGQDLSWGSTEPGAPAGLLPEFLELIGVPGFRVVHGYGGTAEILAAFDRGELEATGLGGPELAGRLFPEWIENQFYVPIVWWVTPLSDDFLDQLGVEQPPYLFDVIDVTDEERAVFELAVAINALTRGFALAPDTPDSLYEVWIDAFEATVTDPEFIADAEAAGYEVGLGTAEDIAGFLSGVDDLSPEGLELFEQLSGVTD
jgi:hypothetical protein